MARTSIVDSYLIYSFIKRLVQPFEKWDAYKSGVIDADGNIVIKPEERTDEQDKSFKLFDLLVLNLKKLLAKIPGGGSRLATFAAALYLIKEEQTTEEMANPTFLEESFLSYMKEQKDLDNFIKNFEDKMPASLDKKYKDLRKEMDDLKKKGKDVEKKYHVNEEAPANSIGAGNIAGMSADDVPGKIPANRKSDKKRKDARMAFFRRTGHPVEKSLVREESHFAGSKVFDVDFDAMWRSRHGKPKYHRYAKYVGADECGEAVREYCRSNPKKPVVLRDSKTGSMMYFRKDLSEQFELNEGLADSLTKRIADLRLKIQTARMKKAAANDNSAKERFDRDLATLRRNLLNLDQQLDKIKKDRY